MKTSTSSQESSVDISLSFTTSDSNTTVSSDQSNISADSADCSVVNSKEKSVAKRRQREFKKKEKKAIKRKKRNKISKDDYYNKTIEFRQWLAEKKNIDYDGLLLTKGKKLFKKFVKKWNSKKLPQKYYHGVEAAWMFASPSTQTEWAMPKNIDVTPGSIDEETLEANYSRIYKEQDLSLMSTFGRKKGVNVLKELQIMNGNNSKKEQNVYDEPMSPGNKSLPPYPEMTRQTPHYSTPCQMVFGAQDTLPTPPHTCTLPSLPSQPAVSDKSKHRPPIPIRTSVPSDCAENNKLQKPPRKSRPSCSTTHNLFGHQRCSSVDYNLQSHKRKADMMCSNVTATHVDETPSLQKSHHAHTPQKLQFVSRKQHHENKNDVTDSPLTPGKSAKPIQL